MMNHLDAALLARGQFAFTMAVHILFPAFSIGIASFLAVLEGLWLLRGDDAYKSAFDYWKKIFAVVFGMGVVSGLVMSYQFGTNWSVFSDKAGPVIGPLMGYEVMSAFFLEAGFLGVMLFGEQKVGRALHFFATVMVAAGTLFSAFWILAVNSWMQTPAGFGINAQGQYIPLDWMAVIFNPSFPYRLVHMVLAAYLTTAFAVGGVGAFHLLRDNTNRVARLMFSMALWMAAIVAPLQILAGDAHGINTLEHQPAKIAAMEGDFTTKPHTPLILFGIPDMKAQTTHDKIEIPYLGALILTHSLNGSITGLKHWPRNEQPDSTVVFFSFRLMVALGFAMAGFGLWGLYLRWRGRLYDNVALRWAALALAPAGFIAVLAGWITTEVGRQPYTIYGLLRTDQSISPIAAPAVAASLLMFVVIYFSVFGAGVFYLLRLMNRTPGSDETDFEDHGPSRAAGITPVAGLASSHRVAPFA